MLLVLFASKRSDKSFYDAVCSELDKAGVEYTLRIASAHKSPKAVSKILHEREYSAVITGAGLAAALPGVVAAELLCPVVGVPLDNNFKGLDSLLSIVQMPPGIPVMSTAIANTSEAVRNTLLFSSCKSVNLSEANEKATKLLNKFGIEYSIGEPKEGCVNINFGTPSSSEFLVINVPVKDDIDDYMAFDSGLYVGKGRGDNAAIAAAEILIVNGVVDKQVMIDYRKENENQLIEADKEERK